VFVQVRDFIQGIGVENIGKRLINSREGKVRDTKQQQQQQQLARIGLLKWQQTCLWLPSGLLGFAKILTDKSIPLFAGCYFSCRLTSRSLPCPLTC
jgi:hypothetical protein